MSLHAPHASAWPRRATIAVFGATVAQLFLATFSHGLSQFEGKGFGARLIFYPLLMLAVPVGWLAYQRRRDPGVPRDRRPTPATPWAGFGLIMAPFLIDVTGNSANLYDTVDWWDDANHFLNWLLLCLGIGVLLRRTAVRPPWALGVMVTGIGALLAIGWELGEWYTFIRHGTELATAYQDTLLDEPLGSLGGAVAGVFIARRARTPD